MEKLWVTYSKIEDRSGYMIEVFKLLNVINDEATFLM